MGYFDKEDNILEQFRELDNSECYPINGETVEIFPLVRDETNWKFWTNSSGKSDMPPDYYCDEFKLMMEVMRVDDHAYQLKKKGKTKIIDPVAVRESEMRKELKSSGILDNFPDVEILTVAKLPKLQTDDFRNYMRYKENFIRVIDKHRESIQLYRKNHPGYKLIFFIMDESEEYIEVETESIANEKGYVGKNMHGKRHYPFLDEDFINPLIGSDIDFLVWYMPYKLIEISKSEFADPLPKVCIIDVKKIKTDMPQLYKYDEKRTISTGI